MDLLYEVSSRRGLYGAENKECWEGRREGV
jgi:hypothetical protein